MAGAGRLLCIAFLVGCVYVARGGEVHGGGDRGPSGGNHGSPGGHGPGGGRFWSSTRPANCTGEVPDVAHTCYSVLEGWQRCYFRVCCSDMREGEGDEVTGGVPEEEEVRDETHGRCRHDDDDEDDPDDDDDEVRRRHETCIESRWCKKYACIKDCCEGYYRDLSRKCKPELECKNGGTRMEASGWHYCKCTPDFYGATCEKPKCNCLNHGRCHVRDGKPVCECPLDYYGERCEFRRPKPTTTTPKPTTEAPTPKPTTKAPTPKPTTTAPTPRPTTKAPTPKPTTTAPTPRPTTKAPTPKPTTTAPTPRPTTKAPTPKPTTTAPTPRPTTKAPTSKPTTMAPTPRPTTKAPTPKPTTTAPTPRPTTKSTTPRPTTFAPTPRPTTKAPTPKPTTKAPTPRPTTKAPTPRPTTTVPTPRPTTKAPTPKPTTMAPTPRPTTKAPTPKPTTTSTPKPTTTAPKPTTKAPTPRPTTKAPTTKPTTEAPTTIPIMKAPTIICPKYTVTLTTMPSLNGTRLNKINTMVEAYNNKKRPLEVSFSPYYLEHCGCHDSRLRWTTVMARTGDPMTGLSAYCTLKVRIKDPHAPTFSFCPESVDVYEGEPMEERPVAIDNVGIARQSCSPNMPDAVLPYGKHAVRCEAWDYDLNHAVCSYTVNVLREDAPIEGSNESHRKKQDEEESKVSHGLIIGPIVGLLAILAILAAVWCCLRRKQNPPPLKAVPQAVVVPKLPKRKDGAVPKKKPATPPSGQYFENHIYNLPMGGKFPRGPPSYAPSSGPPSYAGRLDLKGCEYMYLKPPTYAESIYGKAPSYVSSGYDSIRSVNTIRSSVIGRGKSEA